MAGSASNSYLQEDLLSEDEDIPRVPWKSSKHTYSRRGREASANEDDEQSWRSRPLTYTDDLSPMPNADHQSTYVVSPSTTQISGGERRFVLALDFGTTFTGVAFASVEAHVGHPRIEILRNWSPTMSNMDKVPSVMSYTSRTPGKPQWGADISDDALTLINLKLELELQESRMDELDLTLYVLNGTHHLSFDYIRRAGPNPDFPRATPDQIVTEYLKRVFECTRGAIQVQQLSRTSTPVDLVITMPVDWTYQARNSVFRATRAAGFNQTDIPTLRDTILVSEPEAAAYYTAKQSGTGALQVKKCFILCDAGGGTVDAVAFQVKQFHPFLVLEKVTKPTGRKCGSALIDTEFKRWLRKTIGTNYYALLDPVGAQQPTISPYTAESPDMRTLIKSFYNVKSKFTSVNKDPIRMELPAPLKQLTIANRVNEGELIMQWGEMKKIMDECVNPTIDLILAQIDKVGRLRGTEVKTVFLVGGFGASPYLKEELKASFNLIKAEVVHPGKNSLTAVVQGAVIIGIERPRTAVTMTHMTKTYGHVDQNNGFRWFVRWGDLILDDRPAIWHSEKFWISPPSGMLSSVTFRLLRFDDGDGSEDQELPSSWKTGWDDVQVAGSIKVPKIRLSRGSESSARKLRLTGPFRWRVTFAESQLYAELLLGENLLGRCENIATVLERKPRAGPYDES